jgi:hypothetical protein
VRTLIRESASVPLGPGFARSESRPEAESGPLLAGGQVSAFQALTWLTVGLGVLVTGLAAALTVLAIFR